MLQNVLHLETCCVLVNVTYGTKQLAYHCPILKPIQTYNVKKFNTHKLHPILTSCLSLHNFITN